MPIMSAMPRLPARQQGATLIIVVTMLVLITLIVLAGARSVTQQNSMASNARERDLAFQAAEAALRDAEARIPVFHANFAGAGLIVSNTTADITERATAAYWTNTYGWYNAAGVVNSAVSIQSATAVAGVDEQPRYVVERLPNGPAAGNCPGQTYYRYRVTTIAGGASTGTRKSAESRVILQAEFRYCAA